MFADPDRRLDMYRNSLLITIPPEITSTVLAYDLDLDSSVYCRLFDESDRLILYPDLNGYTPKSEQQIILTDGYAATRATTLQLRREIDISVSDGRTELRDIIAELIDYQRSTVGVLKPLALRDYVLPEKSDRLAGYTDRVGVITELEAGGATWRTEAALNSRRLQTGSVRFVFQEIDPRSKN